MKGLSSLTLGRLKDGTMPRCRSVASIVEPFIGPPLSEWSTSPFGSTFYAAHVARTSADEAIMHSSAWTSKPTMRRLQTSSTR